MAKFLPIIGEIYTTVESGILIASAGVAKIVGDDEKASKLANSAGKAWKEYSETNIIVSPINMIVNYASGNDERVQEIGDSFIDGMESCVDGLPVVGHVKGVVHYAMGDKDKGHRSMEASTRNVAVLGAGIVTGGLGAGVAAGAAVGIGTGVAYDGTATVVDHAVNGKGGRLHGSIALARPDKMNPNEFVGGIIGIAGDGLTGAGGAQLGKSIRASIKNRQMASVVSKKTQRTLNKPNSYAKATAKGSATGKKNVRHSANYKRATRVKNYNSSGFKSKGAARRANGYGKQSHLQTKYKNIRKVHSRRLQTVYAEQPFNENVNSATVYNKGSVSTIARCKNCQAYIDGVGSEVTACIPKEPPVPTSSYARYGSVQYHAGAAGGGTSLVRFVTNNPVRVAKACDSFVRAVRAARAGSEVNDEDPNYIPVNGEPSHLQTQYENVEQVHPTKPQAASNEHQPTHTIPRCEKCQADRGGKRSVATYCALDGSSAPTCGSVRNRFVALGDGSIAVAYTANNDDEDEIDSD